MKKLILLAVLSSTIFAKFPHENDAKLASNLGKIKSAADLKKSVKKISNFEFDNTEGKILAAMYNMKMDKIEVLKQESLDLLIRASTVVKTNMDSSKPVEIDGFIDDLKNLNTVINHLDADEIDFKDLEALDNEIENKSIEFETLIERL